MEVVVALSSLREAKGFGGKSIAGLKHILVMVVTGSVTRKVASVLKHIYEQVKDPKYVVAVGTCAVSGGVFRRSYNVVGGVDRVIPVDLYIPGCPPHPKAIVEGIRRLVEKAGEKS
ncbi:MAG TPA: NADH-quinone oxidoreductase subunit NuoB [Pyrodictium sp.]|nr:NADH-quinone oxidoreductase subunit NuoB [Pyrodictium sp.]